MNKVSVIINNRDLLTWPKEMVEKIKCYENVGDIFIIDNNSTYEPLLKWYDTKPCEIIKLDKNIGHTAPWDCGVVNDINGYYVVSDPDLGINETPNNTLTYLVEKLEKLKIPKIGLGLRWDLTPIDSPYYFHIINYERKRFNNSQVIDGIHVNVPMDTTFALYSEKKYFIGGGCTEGDYMAKHYPWYLTNAQRLNNKEFMYYINNANNSSSYKTYLHL